MPIANYINRKRQSEIDGLIDQIQLITGLRYPDDDLIEIIQAFIPGVLIVENDFGGDQNMRGAIFKKSEEFAEPLIVIQEKQPKAAKTFALAHEFGHYSLDHTGDANFMLDKFSYDGSDEMQKEADAQYFAASLLMPREKFIGLMNFLSDKALAQRFGVSESAVRVRKAWLDGNGRDRAL